MNELWASLSYFFIISLDFCLMLFWLRQRSRQRGFSSRLALDVAMFSSIIGFFVSRLFHVFYEQPVYYRQLPWAVFSIWKGGFVILPGLITGVCAGVLLLRKKNENPWLWLDLFAPIFALGYALGRWACFFQGCCYGIVTNSFIGVHFEPEETALSLARIPTQLMASFGELFLLVGLLILESQSPQKLKSGQLFLLWMIGHGLNRMIMEHFRDDSRGPLILGLGVSFWLSFGFVLIGSIIFFKRSCLKNEWRFPHSF